MISKQTSQAWGLQIAGLSLTSVWIASHMGCPGSIASHMDLQGPADRGLFKRPDRHSAIAQEQNQRESPSWPFSLVGRDKAFPLMSWVSFWVQKSFEFALWSAAYQSFWLILFDCWLGDVHWIPNMLTLYGCINWLWHSLPLMARHSCFLSMHFCIWGQLAQCHGQHAFQAFGLTWSSSPFSKSHLI